MPVDNPIPGAASLLVLALPGVWYAGRHLAGLALRDIRLARLTAPAIGAAVWVLAMHAASLATGSFHSGLWIGTLVPAIAACVLLASERGAGAIAGGRSGGSEETGWAASRWMWAGALAVVVVLAPVALRWAFHDEGHITGHMSIAATIQNGPYPPRWPSLPAFELRYHYGFGVLTAAVGALFRLPVHRAIDAITLLGAGYAFTLLWALGDRLLGAGRGWLLAVITMFGAGAPLACAGATDSLTETLLSYCAFGGAKLNPPLVSYLFQHPWTIGLPIALTLTIIASADEPPRFRRHAVIGMLLVALSFAQIVLFAAMAAALIASESLERGLSPKRGLAMAATSAAALLVASRIGGFFADAPAGTDMRLVPQFGVAGGFLPSVAWHVAAFGLLLPIGLLGLRRVRNGRVLALCLAAGGLLVMNLLRYAHSWDIAKFGAVAAIGLSIGASAAVAGLLESGTRLLGRAAAAVAVSLMTAGSLLFIMVFGLAPDDVPELTYYRSPAPYTSDEAEAMAWLRRHVEPGESVYRDGRHPLAFAQRAGLSTPLHDPMLERFGVPAALTAERRGLVESWPHDAARFLEHGVVWFVIGNDESAAAARTRDWVERGAAELRARFGELRVFELVGAGSRDRAAPAP